MKTFAIALVVSLAPLALFGADRVGLVDNAPQTELKDFLESAAGAFNSENIDAYEMCFSQSRRKDMRRKIAVLFASEQCSMELIEAHTVDINEDGAEAAVRYKIGNSRGSSEVVSIVKLVRESGRWAIDGETRVSGKQSVCSAQPSSQTQPAGNGWNPYKPEKDKVSSGLQHLVGDIGVRPGMGCSGGRCPVGPCQNGRCGL